MLNIFNMDYTFYVVPRNIKFKEGVMRLGVLRQQRLM